MPSSMSATLVELPEAGVMLAHGPQAVDLLHAQLTQELRDWPADTARMAALCTPQGRMLADLLLWREADGAIALLLDSRLLDATLKRLRMFILRLQCRLDDARDQRRVFGLLEALDPDATLPGSEPAWQVRHEPALTRVRLPDAPGWRRTLLVAHGEPGIAALPRLPQGSAQEWRLAEIRAGIGHVSSATAQQFVPQMLNYEVLGAVNFQKGCYPGQEVVARTQYRGSIKRRTFRVLCGVPLGVGDEVFHSEDPGQPCGLIVGAAQAGTDAWEALAELKLAATQSGTLHLRASDGPPLQLGTLPYSLAQEA
jgi:folate-binding protein YgfZ